MALRIRRHARYEYLRKAAFLPFEARPLSRVPSYVPYFRAIVKERRDMARKALKMGTKRLAFETQIRELYRVNRWVKKNKAGKIVADPWAMLRDFQDKFKDKNPQYDSPWEKRQRNWRDFQSRIEKTLARQKV